MNSEYDVIIIGGGPAGLTAGLYTSRARRRTLLLERGMVGGLITETPLVENYPGFVQGISGLELGQLMHQQAEKYGLEMILVDVTGIETEGPEKAVITDKGRFAARSLVIATGSERSKLGVPGEAEFGGRGVSYCGTCDAPFFREKTVAIVGGGNVAVTEAMHLTKFASKVKLIHRRDQLRATRVLQEKALAEPKIEPVWNTVVEGIEGEAMVRRLRLRQVKTGELSNLDVDGVFISVGISPNTSFARGKVPLDDAGYVITNENMETTLPGVFAAGDVRLNSAKQAITAAGDGATAAVYVEKYLGG